MTRILGDYDNSRFPLGFTPIRNKRIEAAIAAEGIRLLKAGLARPDAVHNDAIRNVAANLPASPFARRLRLPRPSKNDSPIYRKQACSAA
ncbi:hypothetical protein LH128_07607 [Sphingomonas sp. LH128]|uniref:hypothetical protein n=1 Tax=Sphingomonas sp. LH128 TaxID=473781 RepID=UPI00027CC4E7|nr:hypothetical protein [Sphingomonas sp. LH128]EJU13662.1 hypothetical protein LH128_07607 [Sphingomonas sp. LH128]